jgi:hypothetical protein
MNVFRWLGRTPEGVRLRRSAQDNRRSRGKTSAAVTTVDANMLRRVPENAVRRSAACLETDEGRHYHLL